jgi:PKHD-type hydroxylase
MLLMISAITDELHLAAIGDRLALLEWRDGRSTAGPVAREVKHNLQAVMDSTAGRALAEQLHAVVIDNPVVRAAAQPRRLSPLIISKMGKGGHYGPHIDNALMAGRQHNRIRADLAFTLFLTAPDDYDGGELVVHSAGQTQEIKGEAGQMVLYPASSIHEVRPVTRGERIVCVGWIESLIAEPANREILFDLENLRSSLRSSLPAQSGASLTLDKTIANLMRLWARP